MRTYPVPRGSLTKHGYRRITCKDRKQRFEHVLLWERHHGPVPPGMEIHHINGDIPLPPGAFANRAEDYSAHDALARRTSLEATDTHP